MTDIVTPPTIDALPPAPLPTDAPEAFNAKSFATLAAQVALVTQVNASNAATHQNAVAADERAVAANASAVAAGLSETAAETAKDDAIDARDLAQTYAAAAGAAAGVPALAGQADKSLHVKTNESGVEWRASSTTGPRNWYVSQHTASGTFVVPAGVTSIRPYAFGAGAAGTTTNSGGGGGCAYGDIAVTPGASVTLSIASGVAKVTYGGVDLLTANPASGTTGGTASKDASVTNGGAYSGGAGAATSGGASSGSPLGAGVNGSAAGGSGWGGAGGGLGGGGVGSASASIFGGSGLPSPSTDPLLDGLVGEGATAGVTYGGSASPGGGGGAGVGTTNANGQGGNGGFGGGGGPGIGNGTGSGFGGLGGFGGGGGRGHTGTGASQSGGAGGYGGGGGQGANAAGAGGAAVIRIYY